MYNNLIKRLNDFAASTQKDEDARLAFEAITAICNLVAFKEKITDGRFYFAKDGILFELKNDPRKIRISSPEFKVEMETEL